MITTKYKILSLLILLLSTYFNSSAEDIVARELTGKIISYDKCNDIQFPVSLAFDNNVNTYFRSCAPFGNWIGYDLGKQYVITDIAYCPRIDANYTDRLQLGVFEGANQSDFGDAITLFLIPGITEREITKQKITCSRAFRYVRFVFPYAQAEGKSSYISELKFYGYESVGTDAVFPQITNLPTVSIHTVESQDVTSKEYYIKGTLSVIYGNGTNIYTDSLEIKGRGNNSWTHPKKPYRLKLANSTHLLGLPAKAKNWTLINSYGDKTLMRNILAFDFSRRLQMPYTSPAEAVDVVLNGDYKGCYQLCDQIEVKKNRVETDQFDSTNVNTGYLIEIDAYSYLENKKFTSTTYSIPVTIKYPDEDEITSPQESYIASHFEKMTASVSSANYANPITGFRKYIDTDTFLKYFLIGEYSGNTDTYWSVNMVKKKDDDKFYFGPVWDYDLGFENDNRTYSITSRTNENNEWIALWSETSAAGGTKNMIRRILSDPEMLKRLKEIYAGYRKNNSKKMLEDVADSCANLLVASQELNFKRWPIMNTLVHQNPVIFGSYDDEVKNIKNYILNRVDWLDKKLEYMPTKINEVNISDRLVRIYSSNQKLSIEDLPSSCCVKIFDLYGNLRAKIQNHTEFSMLLVKGAYIIAVETNRGLSTYKLLVY